MAINRQARDSKYIDNKRAIYARDQSSASDDRFNRHNIFTRWRIAIAFYKM